MLPPHVVPSLGTASTPRVPAPPHPQPSARPRAQQLGQQKMLSLTWAHAGVRGAPLVAATPVPPAASSKLSPELQEPHIEGEEEPPR